MKYSITQLFPGTKSMLYIGLTAVLMVGSLGCKKNVHKNGVVELRHNMPGGSKNYYAFVVKSEPNIPAYQLVTKEKPGSSSSMDLVYWPDKSVEELGYKKDFDKYMHSTVEEEIGGKYTRTFVMAVGEGGGNIPGPNGWWGNGGGGSGTSATEIWYRWTEDLSNPTGNAAWCDWSAQSYYRNSHPNIPDYATKEMYYGPCTPGSFHFYLETSGAWGGYDNELTAPAPGYKRYYTHRIKEYRASSNTCVFVNELTYVDEPL